MSWQAYVDSSLCGTPSIDKAAIFGLKGGQWATTAGFTVSDAEAAEISKGFTNEFADLRAHGLHIAGVKYVVTRAEERSIYAVKGKEGIVIVHSKQAVLIAHYPPNVQANQATIVVENLADYLEKQGY